MNKCLAVILTLWLCPALAASAPAVEAQNGMVVSSHLLASQAGVEILREGGNAVDAAVAVVEWGDVAPELLGVRRVLIRISPGAAEEERRFELEAPELDRPALSAALAAWMIP